MKLTIGNLKDFHIIVSEYTYDLYEVKTNQKQERLTRNA